MHSPSASLPIQANQHFLNALIDVSSQRDIEVSEDVFTQNGIKLLARGTRVSPKLYGQVVSHKLRKPIETSLSINDASDTNDDFIKHGESLLDELPLLRKICDWSHGTTHPLQMLNEMKFTGQTKTLLAVAHSRGEQLCRHHVLVSLLAMGLAYGQRYNDSQLLVGLGMGGIFHDVGELYIDPSIMHSEQPLTPKEWMSYSSHPIIGAALAREIAGFDPLVQRCILEHHERLDGFGYPRCLQGQAISPAGRLLGLAETLSALMVMRSTTYRIGVALKIMPGEYEPHVVSLLNDLINQYADDLNEPHEQIGDDVVDSAHRIFLNIANALSVHDEVEGMVQSFSSAARTALEESFQRFIRVQRAFASTGIAGLAELRGQLSETELNESRFEASCVLGEISWRLLKLSRELSLKCLSLPQEESNVLMRFAGVLAGEAA